MWPAGDSHEQQANQKKCIHKIFVSIVHISKNNLYIY